MNKKKRNYGYDVNDDFDKVMAIDVPFEQLNKAGRKAKRKALRYGENIMNTVERQIKIK